MQKPVDPSLRPPSWLTLAEEIADIGFWRMHPTTGAVEWSPNMFRLFEFPPGIAPRAEETMSRMHPDDRAGAYAELSSNILEGGHISVSRLILPSGRVRIVESRTTTQRDASGEIAMIVGSVLDITTRVERERQLLESRKLAQKNEIQQRAHAANLSHEIRTPLTAIVGYSYLLGQRDDLTANARHEVDLIVRSSETLLTIANNVLGQSRASATLGQTDIASVDVRRVVESAIGLFAEEIAAKGLTVFCRIDDGLPSALNTHGGALTQVLVNLISNAVKFTESGSITLSAIYNDRSETLSLAIQDTGRGFDEHTREALFQRFSRGSEVHRLPSGAGLGLSICKGLVDALEGNITASSSPGLGSCFTVQIPAEPSPAAFRDSESTSAASRVLVIDDHPAIREIASRILEAAGADVAVAADGQSALQLAHLRQFDLILIDLNLPDIGGVEVAECIRRSPGPNTRTRLVAFTAADIDLSNPPRPFDACIGKPVHPSELAALVSARQSSTAKRNVMAA